MLRTIPTAAVAPAARQSATNPSSHVTAPAAAPSTIAALTSPKPIADGDTRWHARSGSAIAAALFFATTAIVPHLPTQFINAGSEKILAVTIAPPTGASSEAVLAKSIEAETILLADPEVKLVQTTVPGEGDASFQVFRSAQSGIPANSATMTVRLEDTANLTESTARLTASLEPVKTDGYDVIVGSAGGFTSNGLTVIVSGPDPVGVEQATAAMMASLADEPGIINLKSDLVKATPEIQITVDPNKAITVGLTAAQVAGEVDAAVAAVGVSESEAVDRRDAAVHELLGPAGLVRVVVTTGRDPRILGATVVTAGASGASVASSAMRRA